MAALIDAGKGPKTVARDLTKRGRPVAERTVASWREGRYLPPADTLALMSLLYGVPIDPLLAAEPSSGLADQLADHRARLAALEDRLGHLAMLTGHDQALESLVRADDDTREAVDRSLADLRASRRKRESGEA